MKITNIFEGNYDSRLLEDLDERVFGILSKESPIDEYLRHTTENLLSESHDFMQVKFGYKVLEESSIEVKKDSIMINDDLTFHTHRIIAPQLKGIEGLIIFASTLGKMFDDWFKEFFNSGDVLEGYIADIIGSVAVECAADVLEDKIHNEFAKNELGCSNRYSPGYCEWNVSEQKKLFSLLPGDFCGIKLTDSALMVPIKSVSGIIGFGKNVIKKEYSCKICTQENCYMNKLKVI